MDVGPLHSIDFRLNLSQAAEPVLRLPEKKVLIEAVKAVNKAELFGQENEVTFILDRKSQKMLVRIVNKETGELVRQIPDSYLRRLASGLTEE